MSRKPIVGKISLPVIAASAAYETAYKLKVDIDAVPIASMSLTNDATSLEAKYCDRKECNGDKLY